MSDYDESIAKCYQYLMKMYDWVEESKTDTPNSAQVQEMAELAVRLKYAESVTWL